jgi:hypothetical protein
MFDKAIKLTADLYFRRNNTKPACMFSPLWSPSLNWTGTHTMPVGSGGSCYNFVREPCGEQIRALLVFSWRPNTTLTSAYWCIIGIWIFCLSLADPVIIMTLVKQAYASFLFRGWVCPHYEKKWLHATGEICFETRQFSLIENKNRCQVYQRKPGQNGTNTPTDRCGTRPLRGHTRPPWAAHAPLKRGWSSRLPTNVIIMNLQQLWSLPRRSDQ